MLTYCVPLIPTAVFWWIMGVSDRYLVKWFVGSDANGIYAVAYKIPTILTILATVFMDAWQLSAIAESGDRRAQARFYARVWDAFFSAVCLCAGGIIAFSPLLIRLLAAESYYDAWRYIPILTLSMIAAAFSNFMGIVYVVTKKSTASLWISLAGAAANIALDLFLIRAAGALRAGLLLLGGLAVGVLVGNVCLKNFIARPHPCWLDSSVRLLIADPTDYSFPSGHTLSSVIGATILTKTDRRFGYAAIPLAALIAFSRLYLYVHFPSDVLAAAVLGVMIGELAFYADRRWTERRGT